MFHQDDGAGVCGQLGGTLHPEQMNDESLVEPFPGPDVLLDEFRGNCKR